MLVDSYYGRSFPEGKCDLISYALDKKLLAKEPSLCKSKWFDYRHLHPTKATYLFAWHFRNESRKLYCRTRNVDGGMLFEPFAIMVRQEDKKRMDDFQKWAAKARLEIKNKRLLLNKSKDIAKLDEIERALKEKVRNFRDSISDPLLTKDAIPLWKARQLADKIGMPYDTFIREIITSLVGDYRFGSTDEFTHMPRTNRLYSKKVELWVSERWVDLVGCNIPTPTIDHLQFDNELNAQIKASIEKWLCERIGERRNPHFALSHYCFEKKLITEEFAIKFFSSETLNKALLLYQEQ